MKLLPIYIKEFNYLLPEESIARYPLEKRSASKLLLYDHGTIKHQMFSGLPDLLPSEAMLVFNNTKVIHARLIFKKETGAEIEVFLLNPANHENAGEVLARKGSSAWQCMIGNKKRFRENDVLEQDDLSVLWLDREKDLVQFNYGDKSLAEVIEESGSLPIPPYLNRPTETIDHIRYQTSFARNDGSVAAPTAALHFDEEINYQLKKKQIQFEFLTLHVGAGTFKPVSTENAIDHTMHQEYIIFSKELIRNFLEHAYAKVAVGTTSLRSLESLYWFGVGLKTGTLKQFHIPQYFPYETEWQDLSVNDSLNEVLNWMEKNQLSNLEGTSSIYIVPGYRCRMAQGIITNFHQPQSTLLLLIASLVGDDWKRIYEEALKNGYRFLSYGDSSLILF